MDNIRYKKLLDDLANIAWYEINYLPEQAKLERIREIVNKAERTTIIRRQTNYAKLAK